MTRSARRRFWRAAAVAAAAALYFVAVSNRAYELTTPEWLPYHEGLRKALAIGAFTVVGFGAELSEIPGVRGFTRIAVLIGLYSWAIELGQIAFDQSTETFSQHGFDVATGVLGGALGSTLARRLLRRERIAARDWIVLATMALVVIGWFFAVYSYLDRVL